MIYVVFAVIGLGGVYGAVPKLKYELKEYDPNPNIESIVMSGDGMHRITILTSKLFRYEKGPVFDDRPSLAVVNRNLPKVDFTVEENPTDFVVYTDDIEIHFDLLNLNLSGTNIQTNQTWYYPQTIPHDPLWGTIRTLDWLKAQSLVCADNDPVKSLCEYGLLSYNGWGLLDDSKSPRLDGEDWWDNSDPATNVLGQSSVDIYVFLHGNDFKGAISDYSKIGGCVPLPPRSTLGLQWTRWYDMDTIDLKELVTGFPIRGIPLDTLILDMNWHRKPLWGSYMFDERIIPDPAALAGWIKDKGVAIGLNIHDCLFVQDNCPSGTLSIQDKNMFDAFIEMSKTNLTENQTAIPLDLWNRTMALIKEEVTLRGYAEELDIDLWWPDWQQGDGPGVGGLLGGKMNPTIWINKIRYTNYKRWGMKKRGAVMGRFGGYGAHRYGYGFSGDVAGLTWDNLAYQPYFAATAANVLFPSWTFDLTGPVSDPELYVRWTQWAALSPMLRFHDRGMSSGACTYNSFPYIGASCSSVDPWANLPRRHSDAIREAVLLRAQLLPYLYTEIWKTYETGIPWIRPLYYDFPLEKDSYNLYSQFMFGDQITVFPVVTPSSPDAPSGTLSHVWIPPGDWFSYMDGKILTGPSMLERYWDLEEIPMFVRAGTILVKRGLDSINYLGMAMSNYTDLIFEIIPGGVRGDYHVHEDDGLSTDYVDGINIGSIIAQYSWNDQNTTITFTVSLSGQYSVSVGNRKITLALLNSGPIFGASSSGSVPPILSHDGHSVAGLVSIDWDPAVDGNTLEIIATLVGIKSNLQGLRGALSHTRMAKHALDEVILTPGTFPCWYGVPCGHQDIDGSLVKAAVIGERLSQTTVGTDFDSLVQSFWDLWKDCVDREITPNNILRSGTQWSPAEWSSNAKQRLNYAMNILNSEFKEPRPPQPQPVPSKSGRIPSIPVTLVFLLVVVLLNNWI